MLEYDGVTGVQALEKKHKLEPYEKIKEKSVMEMVRTLSWLQLLANRLCRKRHLVWSLLARA